MRPYRLFDGSYNEVGLHGIAIGVADDIPRIPVDDGNQVHKACGGSTVGDIYASDLVHMHNGNASEQIGIRACFQVPFA